MTATLSLVAVLFAVRASAGPALPERPLRPDHPCLVPEERFEALGRADGIETRLARLERGQVVLRATATVPAPPDRVVALLEDVDRWPRFVRGIRKLEWRPGEPRAVHVTFAPPWPLADRDYGLVPAVARDPGGGGTVFWESATEGLPPPVREAARSRGPREIVASLRVLLAAAPSAATEEARGDGRARIVDAAALAAALGSPDPPLVLDARPRREFEEGHVPGSHPADWRDFAAVRPGVSSYLFGDPSRWGLLADPSPKLVERLRSLGLSRGRPVVVVGSPDGWGEEGRVAWMLLALGVDDVALLDGGLPAWRRLAGAPVATGSESPVPPGDFLPLPRPARRVRLDELRTIVAHGSRALLDARTAVEFEGKALRGQRRGGRIPGARLVPASDLRAAEGSYVSAEVLSRLVGPLDSAAPPITYCTGGVRSALLAVLLEARLGVVAANYDGSLWEWSARGELPLATGPTRRN